MDPYNPKSLRSNISHFHKMPKECLDVLDLTLRAARMNRTTWKFSRVTMKLDGFLAAYGKDLAGKTWFRSARSPLMYKGEFHRFSEFAHKNNRPLARAQAYETLAEEITDNLGSDPDFPPGCSIVGEIFDMHQATIDRLNGTAKFVNIPYKMEYLAKRATIFPYELYSDRVQILYPGYVGIMSYGIEMRSPDLEMIDFPNLEFDVFNRDELYEFGQYLLDSGAFKDMYQLGPYIEGVVVWINGLPFKIIADDYNLLRG